MMTENPKSKARKSSKKPQPKSTKKPHPKSTKKPKSKSKAKKPFFKRTYEEIRQNLSIDEARKLRKKKKELLKKPEKVEESDS